MTSEVRFLRFEPEEVVEALKSFAARLAVAVPATPLRALKAVNVAGKRSVALSFQACERPVTVSEGELAASLIAWCQTEGIMLPRESRKQIIVADEYVELRLGIRYARPRACKDNVRVEL